jgi:hypothetical protein
MAEILSSAKSASFSLFIGVILSQGCLPLRSVSLFVGPEGHADIRWNILTSGIAAITFATARDRCIGPCRFGAGAIAVRPRGTGCGDCSCGIIRAVAR